VSFDHFWLYTEKAAADNTDVGFTLFSGGHLVWLAAMAALMIIVVRLYLGSSPGRRIGIRRLLALYLLVTEIVKDVIIVAVGAPLSAYLPLHLCGYAIFFLLIDAFLPEQKTTGQMIAYAFGPGALMALLFCSWTSLPLFWNFMTIHSFLFHAVILAYMIMRLAAGEIVPADAIRSIRPGYGILPKYLGEIIGKKAPMELHRGEPITNEFLEAVRNENTGSLS